MRRRAQSFAFSSAIRSATLSNDAPPPRSTSAIAARVSAFGTLISKGSAFSAATRTNSSRIASPIGAVHKMVSLAGGGNPARRCCTAFMGDPWTFPDRGFRFPARPIKISVRPLRELLFDFTFDQWLRSGDPLIRRREKALLPVLSRGPGKRGSAGAQVLHRFVAAEEEIGR